MTNSTVREMEGERLLALLAQRGIKIRAERDELVITGARGALSPTDVATLRAYKGEILALLRPPTGRRPGERPYWACAVCGYCMWSHVGTTFWYCSNCGALPGDERPSWPCLCGATQWIGIRGHWVCSQCERGPGADPRNPDA